MIGWGWRLGRIGTDRRLSSRRRAALGTPALWAGLFCCCVLSHSVPAAGQQAPEAPAASQRAVVRWKDILTEGNVTRIRLEASSLPRYRVATSATPPRATVELFDVELEGLPPKVAVGDGTVDTVETRALPGGAARIDLSLAGPGDVQVVPWGGGLDLLVHLAGSAAEASVSKSEGERVARRLSDPERLAFTLGAAPSSLSAFLLSDGKRLVVDAEGVELPAAQVVEEFSEGPLARVRMAKQDGRIRAVVEAKDVGTFDGHRLEKTADGFELVLAAAPAAAKEAVVAAAAPPSSSPAPEAAAPKEPAAEEEARGGGSVIDLGFRQEGGRSYVDVVLSRAAPHIVREASGQRLVIDLLHTTLPDKFRRALDTSAFSGPVKMVAAYQRAGRGKGPVIDTRIVVDLKRVAPYRIEKQGPRVTLVVEGGPAEAPVPGVAEVRREGEDVVVVEGKPGAKGAKPQAAPAAESAAKAAPGYTGRRLSMDFMDADVRNVLRLIGEVSGLNMVTGDDVQGKVTIRLVDVPWDQALDVILKTKGLDQVREGNVIRIAPAEKLAQEKARAREAEKGAVAEAPLINDIIPVNYAAAKDLADKVKAVLSSRGSVTVDDRTNALLVKDTADNVKEARALVGQLDTQTPQVLIEARIVEVGSTYSKDLGIQWGGRYTADTAHGNATGWAFPNSVGITGSSTTGNNYAVNFPALVGADAGSALSLTLGHVNDILRLDLRLSALEAAGHGRVVSSPRVATLDNRTAEISQGVSIPFTTATENKIETQSIDYLLKLNVTPHVTSDGSILMKIAVNKDSPSTVYFAVDSKTPAKETRSALTEVMVKNGETTVIGGIITDTQSDSDRGVPFFSKIPYLGWLFKNKVNKVDKTELIIFITPKIANPTALAGGI